MSELLPIQDNDGIKAIMGRDLHAFLEIKSNYREWFPRMVVYGFDEGIDYTSEIRRVQDSLGREREATDHIITLDMAKELSMIQRPRQIEKSDPAGAPGGMPTQRDLTTALGVVAWLATASHTAPNLAPRKTTPPRMPCNGLNLPSHTKLPESYFSPPTSLLGGDLTW
ncbi:antA/AntB antirepressor family protein [Corynebacterium sp. H128]|uniref:antA/AntB antirepressor family protein n=1 Tax=Corynebacterium sp. H128 TaxID=3133427 RepID=UPI0030977109